MSGEYRHNYRDKKIKWRLASSATHQSEEIMRLELSVNMVVEISDKLNERLEQGEDQAFLELENQLNYAFRYSGMRVSDLQIQDAGPHNVVWSDEPPNGLPVNKEDPWKGKLK